MLIHSPTVHFPIALLLAGSLLELWRGHQRESLQTAQWMLKIGWWSGLIASLTGMIRVASNWQAAQAHLSTLNIHAATSIIVLIIYWRLILGQPALSNRRPWLWAGSIGIIITGLLGGQLIKYLIQNSQ